MPVVITELVVRARAGEPAPTGRQQTDAQRQDERARLVEDTVAEVMRLLRRQQEP